VTFWALSSANYPTWTTVVTLALGLVVGPFTRTTIVLLYYDLRIRKEGYDINVMASAIARPIGPQVA